MYLYNLSINYKNSFENIRTDVKMGVFPILIAYWLGFKENQGNPDEIGMVGQSEMEIFLNFPFNFRNFC